MVSAPIGGIIPMKIETSKLTGAALDWAVAKCEGELDKCDFYMHERDKCFMLEMGEASAKYSPST